jgi:hypothetical protein
LAWEKPRVDCHRSANTIEIVRVDISSLHAEAGPARMPAERTAAKLPRKRLRPTFSYQTTASRQRGGTIALETPTGTYREQ